jgi:hypothetical protein
VYHGRAGPRAAPRTVAARVRRACGCHAAARTYDAGVTPPALRDALAVAAAAALGVAVPAYRALDAPGRSADEIDAFDSALAALRPALPRGARVGAGLRQDPNVAGDEMARWFLTEYALAPAIARPVLVPDCIARGAAACGLDDVSHLVLLGLDRGTAVALGQRLGLAPVAASGPFVLLARSAP